MTADEQVADQAESGGPAPTPATPGRGLIIGLALLTLLLAASALALALSLRGYTDDEDARAAALSAATTEALNLTSIDTRDFDGDVRKVVEAATGDFLADFQARTADDQLKAVLTENEVISEGKVIEAGIVRADATNATALVAIDSRVQNVASPEGRLNTYRMQLELELRDGTWLTSSLEFVS